MTRDHVIGSWVPALNQVCFNRELDVRRGWCRVRMGQDWVGVSEYEMRREVESKV